MQSLDNANSLYLIFNNVDVYIEEYNENNENKYLIFVSTGKNKEVLENYTELWDEIKDQVEAISDVKPTKYEKDFMKIKFESNDDKILSISLCIVTVGSVFQDNNNYYQQVYLHECLYEYEYKDKDDCVDEDDSIV